MNDIELEKLLTEQFDRMPPEDSVVKDITPWKKSIKYLFSGLFLIVMDIALFVDITALTKLCGYIFILLGFINLRKENIFFNIGFLTAIVLNIQMILYTLLEMSIWKGNIWTISLELQFIISFAEHILIYVCVWLGIWNVECKVDTGKASKFTILLPISYGIMAILALKNTTGIMAIIWFAFYICILIELYKIYNSLEYSGYVIKPSSIKLPNWVISLSMIIILIIGTFVVSSFNKYPMEWDKYVVEQTIELEEMKQKLIEYGVAEKVLNDLPAEDIKLCANATDIVISDDVINPNDSSDARLLKMISYAFCLNKKNSHWKIIHYFMWEGKPSFYGTELISYGSNEIKQAKNITGYVMYDDKDVTYKAPYYRTDYINVVDGIEYSNIFTGFSFDKNGSNYRGYFTYELVNEKLDITSIVVTIDYFHQNWRVIYPVQTAWDYGDLQTKKKIFEDKWKKFSKIRNSINIYSENTVKSAEKP